MLPNQTLSSTVISAAFLPPRTNIRFSAQAGTVDTHFGGVALGNPSQGIQYQLWTAYIDAGDIWLSAPNTPAYNFLPGVGAVWVALAFDQNSREFLAYSTATGTAYYYWYDSTVPGYTTTALPGVVPRVFAALDDARPQESTSADIILTYTRNNELYFRAQRDRYGIEYLLTADIPATLVQVGMNEVFRFQFAFQNVQGAHSLPPAEFNPGVNQ